MSNGVKPDNEERLVLVKGDQGQRRTLGELSDEWIREERCTKCMATIVLELLPGQTLDTVCRACGTLLQYHYFGDRSGLMITQVF